jgi:hypothetical protein
MTDLEALGAAAATVILLTPALLLSKRIFTRPGPMFSAEGFARFLVNDIVMKHRPVREEDIERVRAVFLKRYPDDEAVLEAALAELTNIQPRG